MRELKKLKRFFPFGNDVGLDIGLPSLIRTIGEYEAILRLRTYTCVFIDANGDRKGHYIVEEYVDKLINKHPPNQPWQVRGFCPPCYPIEIVSKH